MAILENAIYIVWPCICGLWEVFCYGIWYIIWMLSVVEVDGVGIKTQRCDFNEIKSSWDISIWQNYLHVKDICMLIKHNETDKNVIIMLCLQCGIYYTWVEAVQKRITNRFSHGIHHGDCIFYGNMYSPYPHILDFFHGFTIETLR